MFSRLFRLHILDLDHVMRTVPTKAYSKIKDFVHGQSLHHPPSKVQHFSQFPDFLYVFWEFHDFHRTWWGWSRCPKIFGFRYAEKKTLFQAWSEFKMCNPKSLGETLVFKNVFFLDLRVFFPKKYDWSCGPVTRLNELPWNKEQRGRHVQ